MDRLERAVFERQRIAFRRQGNEYVLIAVGLDTSGRGDTLVAEVPMTGEVLRFAITDIAAPFVSIWLLVPIYLTKLGADRYGRFPIWISLLAPVTFLAWAGLHLDSAVSHVSGRVQWKGRSVARTKG
jgi:hypothetical protein